MATKTLNAETLPSQAEMVRIAVEKGHDKPSGGVAYIKSTFGTDVSVKYFSIAKSVMRRRGKLQKPQDNSSSDSVSFDDLKLLRQLRVRYAQRWNELMETIG